MPLELNDASYTDILHTLQREGRSEADLKSDLVRPLLEQLLGYDYTTIREEEMKGRDRPDLICTDTTRQVTQLIVEVKKLGTALDKRQTATWDSAPVAQLQRYLNNPLIASDQTLGLLTNGTEWVLLEAPEPGSRLTQFDIPSDYIIFAETLAEVRPLVERIKSLRAHPPSLVARKEPTPWLHTIGYIEHPGANWGDAAKHRDTDGPLALKHIATPDWAKSQMIFPPRVLACELALHPLDGRMEPRDIHERLLKENIRVHDYTVGIAWMDHDRKRWARGFLLHNGQCLCTALFDTSEPSGRVAAQIEALQNVERSGGSKKAVETATERLEAHGAKAQLYNALVEWFERATLETPENGHATLRHLIRILFVYLLAQRFKAIRDSTDRIWLPTSTPQKIDPESHTIHERLEWFFHEVLPIPKGDRNRCRSLDEDVRIGTPYLNGSLFRHTPDERPCPTLANSMYVGPGGLISLLAQHDWTLSDEPGSAREATIDPKVLGDLFERLIVHVDGIRQEGSHVKMPAGTYYTPRDVADAMTTETLAEWLRGEHVSDPSDWFDLVAPGDNDSQRERWRNDKRRRELLARAKDVTALDPCCGSGEFTLCMLQAIERVRWRLGDRLSGAALLTDVLARQIHAADINPIAVFVARLRVFIAIVDRLKSQDDLAPLPNLDTRILCVDTLSTPVHAARGTRQRWLDEGPHRTKAFEAWRSVRQDWTRASSPDAKARLQPSIDAARSNLRTVLMSRGLLDPRTEWLEADFDADDTPPSRAGLLDTFPAPLKRWDIVVGNPPYQKPDPQHERDAERLGYIGLDNLYLMFMEAALDTSAATGVIALIVPHSITFGKRDSYRALRSALQRGARRIDIDLYDNRPLPVFPDTQWLPQATENRQRVAIVKRYATSRKRTACDLRSSGYLRLTSDTRRRVLARPPQRCSQPPTVNDTWTAAPSAPLRQLLVAMQGKPRLSPASDRGILTYPATAMYFITVLPDGLIENKRRKCYSVPNDEKHLWAALYNSRCFLVYWLMVGDAFDLTKNDLRTVTPPRWNLGSLRTRTIATSKQLFDSRVLKRCRKDHVGAGGKVFPNFDFYSHPDGRTLIDKIDKLILDAYGLEDINIETLENFRLLGAGRP